MRGAVVGWVQMAMLYVMNDDFGRCGRGKKRDSK